MLLNHPEAPIAVLGEAMLDIFVSGDVERISPEAPVPVLRHRRDKLVPGGAGNVACNIAQLGGAPILITLVGDDSEGASLMALLGADGVATEAIVTRGRMTTSKTRVMGGSHHLIRIDREDSSPISEAAEDEVLARLKSTLRRARALAISDYGKGMLTDRVLVGAIAMARAEGVPVIVDPKRRDFSLYAGADVIKPNRLELAAASGLHCHTDEEVMRAAEAAMRQTGAVLLVTRAEKGMSYFRRALSRSICPRRPSSSSTSRAQATPSWRHSLTGWSADCRSSRRCGSPIWRRASSFPNPARRPSRWMNCGRKRRCTRKRRLFAREASPRSTKRGRSGSIGAGRVFPSGSPTAVSTFCIPATSRSCAERLAFATGWWSASIPTNPWLASRGRPGRCSGRLARAAVLGAIDCVDLVVVFDNDTPFDLIGALVPDVLIKGADYTEDQIVGADVVRAAGGRVERIKLVEGQSTSDIIRRAHIAPAAG